MAALLIYLIFAIISISKHLQTPPQIRKCGTLKSGHISSHDVQTTLNIILRQNTPLPFLHHLLVLIICAATPLHKPPQLNSKVYTAIG